MKDYHINIFYSAEDEAYIADVPDFEMCSVPLWFPLLSFLCALRAFAVKSFSPSASRFSPTIFQPKMRFDDC